MRTRFHTAVLAVIVLLGFGVGWSWADDQHGCMIRGGGREMSGHEEAGGHYLRHLLMHAKEIGLIAEQMTKLKAMQLDLSRAQVRDQAEIKVTEMELQALVADEKSEMAAIEAKVQQLKKLEGSFLMAAIKAKREATALLTPDQREKDRAEHEKMVRQMGGRHCEDMGRGGMRGMMGGGGHASPSEGEPKKEKERRDGHQH